MRGCPKRHLHFRLPQSWGGGIHLDWVILTDPDYAAFLFRRYCPTMCGRFRLRADKLAERFDIPRTTAFRSTTSPRLSTKWSSASVQSGEERRPGYAGASDPHLRLKSRLLQPRNAPKQFLRLNLCG